MIDNSSNQWFNYYLFHVKHLHNSIFGIALISKYHTGAFLLLANSLTSNTLVVMTTCLAYQFSGFYTSSYDNMPSYQFSGFYRVYPTSSEQLLNVFAVALSLCY